MNQISRDELKTKIDRGDTFKLVMTLKEHAFRAAHIPGSINIITPEKAAELLHFNDEIVVYCSGDACPASQTMYHLLVSMGYSNIRRYAGGLTDWQAAGYPLESDLVAMN